MSLKGRVGATVVGGCCGAALGAVAAALLLGAPLAAAEAYARHGQGFALAVALGRAALTGILPGTATGVVAMLLAGYVAGRRGRAPRPLGKLGFAFGAIAGAIVLAAVAAASAASLRPAPDAPNLVLVVLDTARLDRMSLYGYARPTTPALEKLARSSRVYTRAYATAPWTCPSHASMFTGLYPCAHHVTQESWVMRRGLLTLAEALWERGYETIGLVGNPMLRPSLGFGQGFDRYEEHWRQARSRDAEHPSLAAFRALLGAEHRRPFFAFVNFIEPHNPYDSSGEFRGRYADPHGVVDNAWADYFTGRRAWSEAELRQLSDAYDEEIAFVDAAVGRILADLETRGLLEKTVVVVTSDHGENLGDHQLLDHVFSVHDSLAHVPLIVRWPAAFGEGVRDDSSVQLLDLFPTLLGLAGAADRFPSQGVDLAGRPPGSIVRPALVEYEYPRQVLRILGEPDASSPRLAPYKRGLRALRDGDLKLVLADDGTMRLHDLAADPREERDLAADPAWTATAERMRERLRELVLTHATARRDGEGEGDDAVDRETHEKLRSLGYVR